MKINTKGNSVFYVLLVINIALILGYIVLNNSNILGNNIRSGSSSEELYSEIYAKGDMAISAIKQYNSNGKGFSDGISCPTNVNVSYEDGSAPLDASDTVSSTGRTTNLVFDYGTYYCQGTDNNGNEFRIFYNQNTDDFEKFFYKGFVGSLEKGNTTLFSPGTTNIADSTTASTDTGYEGSKPPSAAIDGNISTQFVSYDFWGGTRRLTLDFGSNPKHLSKLILHKDSNGLEYSSVYLHLFDESGMEIGSQITRLAIAFDTKIEIDLKLQTLNKKVKTIKLETIGQTFRVNEVELYELLGAENALLWKHDSLDLINNPEHIKIRFDSTGIAGEDKLDDDRNSDNFKVTSTCSIYYPNNFQDDDVVPRLTIYGNIPPMNTKKDFYNMYWNNTKTNAIIEKNTNNNDTLNQKISDQTKAQFYIDFASKEALLYDMKIIEFSRNDYNNNFTLLPKKLFFGKNLTKGFGYIAKKSSGELYVTGEKTGEEFLFNTKEKDYAIFIQNHKPANISYRLQSFLDNGTRLYISPMDDSQPGKVEFIGNHIISGTDKNYMGDNFLIKKELSGNTETCN